MYSSYQSSAHGYHQYFFNADDLHQPQQTITLQYGCLLPVSCSSVIDASVDAVPLFLLLRIT